MGEASTSSTVTGLRSAANSLYCAWCAAATLTAARCAEVVPCSCMWRWASIPYMPVMVER
ncbi:hypothetical protein D9M70_619330 [compost metagenome]